MAALARAGHVVSGHKVGPDYIDPGYHALATGRPGRNLDPHLVGEERLVPLLLHGAAGADVAVIEGVMGLYDGQIGGDGFASTAHVAAADRAPRSCSSSTSRAPRASIGAVVHGMATFDPSVEVAGVILNKAGSPRHAAEVAGSIDGCRCSASSAATTAIGAPSRHLGLVPAAERDEAAHALDRLADRIAEHVDLEAVLELASHRPGPRRRAVGPGARGGRRLDQLDRRAVRSSRWPAAARSPSATPRPRSCSAPPAATSSTFDPLADAAPARRARPGSTSAAASPRCTPPSCSETRRSGASSRAAIEAGRADRRRVRRAALPLPLGRRRPDGRRARRRAPR